MATSQQAEKPSTPATENTTPSGTAESAIDQAKRAFALKKYEQAVEHYATALELVTKQLGENSPETADLYFSYGMALLENAISQNSVLGKDQAEDTGEDPVKASGSSSNQNGPIFSFSGDAEDMDDEEDKPVDLFGKAAEAVEEEEEGHEEEDDGEPEDDFNAAWEVLDLARAIYDKQAVDEDDDEVKLKLADTYIALGDVSLETEKFDQAITDYEAGLKLKLDLLPSSSRHIAEAHYKISIVLDLTPGRLSESIGHAERALASVEARLTELQSGLAGQLPPLPETSEGDSKGKGKVTKARLKRDDLVQKMSKSQIEHEIKELGGLRDDLALKVEELKTTPNESHALSAPAMAAQALDQELNTIPAAASTTEAKPVTDLTSTIKRKKKSTPEDSTASKRKAEDVEPADSGKKAKLETPEA
ncbi:hypothetical protein CPB83DRAFT_848571 [Crepidotus variabilis]|uniref:Tetratricopeptide SHNi-TPR domain-containing protein n=1 Tax=Crepidotus variabilis TaxID=179855 RepID=A0A9P6JTM0_9AGAR|nr:hypothetical protein CPB83DRAFT_848571 [Crepidotus variabilis]